MRKLEKLGTWSRTFLLLSVLCFFAVLAQAQTVKGVVRDQNGDAIIGASVKILGARGGTVTDNKGQYSIDAPQGSILSVSYIGYLTKQIRLRGENTVDIVLMEDNTTLNDIVVIGYGTQKKSDLTGAVASVKAEEIKNLSATDAGAVLQGKASGVQVVNGSGAPGEGAQIRVRGYASNSDKLSPLLIVDGTKVDNIQYLDPSLIESMEVLKDAASAAIYGAEAGNGVVLITTKNGSAGNAKLSYRLKAINQSLGRKADIFNAADYIEYHTYIGTLNQDKLNAARYNGQDTNWYDELYGNSWSLQHNFTAQGGNDKGHFFADLGILNDDGIVKGNKDVYKRFSVQVNADYQFYKWFTVKSNMNVEKWSKKSLGGGYQSILNAVTTTDPLTDPYVYRIEDTPTNMQAQWAQANHGNVLTPPEYTDENPVWYGTSRYYENSTGNPLAMRDRSHRQESGINVRGNLEANIAPVDGLVYTSRLGYRIQQGNVHDNQQPWWLNGKNAKSDKYSVRSETTAQYYYQWENFINYNKTFGKHTLGLMAGMSFSKRHFDNTQLYTESTEPVVYGDGDPLYNYLRFATDAGKTNFQAMDNNNYNAPFDEYGMSYFGRIIYSFDDRYSVQANFRRDAFSLDKLSKDARWGTFPSFSAGWTISNESFFKNSVSENAISFLKLRASWGQNGSVQVLDGYKWSAVIPVGGYYQFEPTSYYPGGAPNRIANPDLNWEKAEQIDVALDARFLRGRLSLTVDWYKKLTKDFLIQANGMFENGGMQGYFNSGKVLNQGFDIELGWRDNIGDLKYGINVNASPLKNEVQEVSDLFARIQQTGISGFNNKLNPCFEKGHEVWYYRGYEYAGVYSESLYDGDAYKAENLGRPLYYDKDGKLTLAPSELDKKDLGSAIPKFTYGVTLNLEYKGFDLTVFGTGAAGSKIYNLMVSADTPEENGLNYWWKNSTRIDNGNVVRVGEFPDMKKVANDWDFFSSSAALFSGSYFKFKQIQLGYTVPSSITKKFLVSDLRFSVSLDDFFVITDYPGADPEVSSLGTPWSRGFDNGSYPFSKKIVFGVNVSF